MRGGYDAANKYVEVVMGVQASTSSSDINMTEWMRPVLQALAQGAAAVTSTPPTSNEIKSSAVEFSKSFNEYVKLQASAKLEVSMQIDTDFLANPSMGNNGLRMCFKALDVSATVMARLV